MARIVRAALVFLALAATPQAAGASQGLGATLSPAPLVWERDEHQLNLTNRSEWPIVATFDVTGDGWSLARYSLPLAVDERSSVAISAAGEGDARIRVTLSPQSVPDAPDRLSLVLETTVRHLTVLERIGTPVLFVIGVLIALLALRAVLARSRRAQRGQAIAETALVLPVVLFTGLGFLEAGFLVAEKADQDRATAVLADWAAAHHSEDWHAIANQELPGCAVAVDESMPDLVTATATCQYSGRVTRGILDVSISSEESAAVRP